MNRWISRRSWSPSLLGAMAAMPIGAAANGRRLMRATIMETNFLVSKVSGVRLEATMVLINDKGQQRERRNTTLIKLQANGIDSKLVVKFIDAGRHQGDRRSCRSSTSRETTTCGSICRR